MGRIGRSVAKRAPACGMRISYHNSNRLPQELKQECQNNTNQLSKHIKKAIK